MHIRNNNKLHFSMLNQLGTQGDVKYLNVTLFYTMLRVFFFVTSSKKKTLEVFQFFLI